MNQPIKFFLLLIILSSKIAFADLIVSVRAPETENDVRENYNVQLINLALEKTKPKYGSFQLKVIPIMSRQRVQFAASSNLYPNLVIEESYQDKFINEKNLIYVNFPIELGILGMRICFTNTKLQNELNQIKQLSDLRKYSFGQGVGWADVDILKHQGLRVIEIQNYDSLFKMTSAGRIDLFCRGVNELHNEYRSFGYLKNLSINESFAIYYPFPRFYFTHANNKLLRDRLEEGLKQAYADGSLKNLLMKHYGESIEFANLKKRTIFKIENPLIKNLPENFFLYHLNLEK